MWGLFLSWTNTPNYFFVSWNNTHQGSFGSKKIVRKNRKHGFANTPTQFQAQKRMFHETKFCDFDGFAKPYPSTLWFRETIVVSRNQLEFDRPNREGHTVTTASRLFWLTIKSVSPLRMLSFSTTIRHKKAFLRLTLFLLKCAPTSVSNSISTENFGLHFFSINSWL